MNAYNKYLTIKEREKIKEIERKIMGAKSIKEVELYREQIGLIMGRIVLRRKYELSLKNNETSFKACAR